MKKITIPNTDLELSPMGMGCVNAGIRWEGKDAFRIFDAFLDMGGTVYDTARVYMDSEMQQYHIENPQNLAMPYMSVASGFFHKLYAGGAEAVRNSEYYTPENLKIAEGLHGLMEEYQISLTQAVLGYLTCRDFTCLPLYGPRNIEDLKDAMGTFSIPFLKEYYPEG